MKTENVELKKRMRLMLIIVGIFFGAMFLFHLFKNFMMKRYFASMASPVITVSAMPVDYATWQPQLKATASLRAVEGVDVTTESDGMIKEIIFAPGTLAKKGDVLVRLNADPDIAEVHSLEADAALAKITYTRDKAQYAVQAVSKATLDTDEANYKSTLAKVERQKALVEKKIIRAPFDGRLGIRKVNLGQYLNPGDKVTSLERLDPIYADFYLPQQTLTQIEVGQEVMLTVDGYPNQVFAGKITTVDSAIDQSTRNIEVEATLTNAEEKLIPGMFGGVTVNAGASQRYLTVPHSAVSFNPYGEIVYILTPETPDNKKKKNKKEKSQQIYTANQHFVTTGDMRGDQVTILNGLKAGDFIVTSGQLKLHNGSRVIINNSVVPDNNPNPQPSDE